MIKTTSAWFQSNPVPDQIDLKMFCFPYAGGTALLLKKWAAHLPSTLHVIPVLPGDHFFIRLSQDQLLKSLAHEIDEGIDHSHFNCA